MLSRRRTKNAECVPNGSFSFFGPRASNLPFFSRFNIALAGVYSLQQDGKDDEESNCSRESDGRGGRGSSGRGCLGGGNRSLAGGGRLGGARRGGGRGGGDDGRWFPAAHEGAAPTISANNDGEGISNAETNAIGGSRGDLSDGVGALGVGVDGEGDGRCGVCGADSAGLDEEGASDGRYVGPASSIVGEGLADVGDVLEGVVGLNFGNVEELVYAVEVVQDLALSGAKGSKGAALLERGRGVAASGGGEELDGHVTDRLVRRRRARRPARSLQVRRVYLATSRRVRAVRVGIEVWHDEGARRAGACEVGRARRVCGRSLRQHVVEMEGIRVEVRLVEEIVHPRVTEALRR